MEIKNSQFSSIEQVTGKYLDNSKGDQSTRVQHADSFKEVLRSKVEAAEVLKFSKHANARLDSRQICLSEGQIQRLQSGAKKAEEKGIRESLVLVDSLAFIVSTKDNTVITAMDQRESSENIYTNIDGAVIM